jgi:hypothetical protein
LRQPNFVPGLCLSVIDSDAEERKALFQFFCTCPSAIAGRKLGLHMGLTPRVYQSGEIDRSGNISKCGDKLMRHALYEAANSHMRPLANGPASSCSPAVAALAAV